MNLTHDIFNKPLQTIDDAKRLLRYLKSQGLDYHCEDNAEDVVDGVTGRVFTDDEAEALNVRMNEAFSFDWGGFEDPCGYALHLDPDYTQRLRDEVNEGEKQGFEVAVLAAIADLNAMAEEIRLAKLDDAAGEEATKRKE